LTVTVVEGVQGVDVWGDVVGQDDAVRQLEAAVEHPVHAYLLLGPSGSGKRALARAFAARLLSVGSTGADAERHVRLALAEHHPDLRVVVPEGMTFRRRSRATGRWWWASVASRWRRRRPAGC
jgi:hypothetical protein